MDARRPAGLGRRRRGPDADRAVWRPCRAAHFHPQEMGRCPWAIHVRRGRRGRGRAAAVAIGGCFRPPAPLYHVLSGRSPDRQRRGRRAGDRGHPALGTGGRLLVHRALLFVPSHRCQRHAGPGDLHRHLPFSERSGGTPPSGPLGRGDQRRTGAAVGGISAAQRGSLATFGRTVATIGRARPAERGAANAVRGDPDAECGTDAPRGPVAEAAGCGPPGHERKSGDSGNLRGRQGDVRSGRLRRARVGVARQPAAGPRRPAWGRKVRRSNRCRKRIVSRHWSWRRTGRPLSTMPRSDRISR